MKKNFRMFFDMDDTLVDFRSDLHYGDVLEVAYKQGFYLNLKPLPFLSEINKLASMCPENIYILSACVDSEYCVDEKIEWLKKYLPAAFKGNVIFTQVGQDKADAVKEKTGMQINEYDILVDDYSKNIFDWEKAGGTGIKFKNSFNTHDPKKYKYIIKDFSELFSIIEKIRLEIGN